MVKLRGVERVIIEEFKHEPEAYDVWHFWVTVYKATDEQVSESLQRLKPSEVMRYHAGEINLMVVKLEAYCDPRHLGSWISQPVWVEGKTFSQGKIRGEVCNATQSGFIRTGEREAIANGMSCLSIILGRLGMYDARDDVQEAAGIR